MCRGTRVLKHDQILLHFSRKQTELNFRRKFLYLRATLHRRIPSPHHHTVNSAFGVLAEDDVIAAIRKLSGLVTMTMTMTL